MTLKHTYRALVTHSAHFVRPTKDRKALTHMSLRSSPGWHRLRSLIRALAQSSARKPRDERPLAIVSAKAEKD